MKRRGGMALAAAWRSSTWGRTPRLHAAPAQACCRPLELQAQSEEIDREESAASGGRERRERKERDEIQVRVGPTFQPSPGPCCSTREVTAERSTLLHIAASQGHVDLITKVGRLDNTLLSSLNSSRDTPLHFAARAGHADAVNAIFRLAGDNVEEARMCSVLRVKNEAGDTGLHVAAKHGHGTVVETLMKLVPELASELNNAGVSPLYVAVMSRSMHAVAAIVGYRDASAAGPMSQNALHAAVLQSSGNVLDKLLRHVVDIPRGQPSCGHGWPWQTRVAFFIMLKGIQCFRSNF